MHASYFILKYVCMRVPAHVRSWTCAYATVCRGVISRLPPHGFQGLYSGCQPCWQAPSPTESSCWPHLSLFEKIYYLFINSYFSPSAGDCTEGRTHAINTRSSAGPPSPPPIFSNSLQLLGFKPLIVSKGKSLAWLIKDSLASPQDTSAASTSSQWGVGSVLKTSQIQPHSHS